MANDEIEDNILNMDWQKLLVISYVKSSNGHNFCSNSERWVIKLVNLFGTHKKLP